MANTQAPPELARLPIHPLPAPYPPPHRIHNSPSSLICNFSLSTPPPPRLPPPLPPPSPALSRRVSTHSRGSRSSRSSLAPSTSVSRANSTRKPKTPYHHHHCQHKQRQLECLPSPLARVVHVGPAPTAAQEAVPSIATAAPPPNSPWPTSRSRCGTLHSQSPVCSFCARLCVPQRYGG